VVDKVVEVHVVTPERLVRIALLDDGETILALNALGLVGSMRPLLQTLERLPLLGILLALGSVNFPLILEVVST